jgi:hypothetical protein
MVPKKRPKLPQIGYDPDPVWAMQQMKEFVSSLNGTTVKMFPVGHPELVRTRQLPLSEAQEDLRGLVKRWMDSGPNLRRMFRRDPDLARKAQLGRTEFYAGPSGRGYLEWSPSLPDAHPYSREVEALKHFMGLITNPLWELLGGPCRRCGNYFLKNTERKRIYCSRTCSSAETSTLAITKRRQQDQAKKRLQAQRFIAKWDGRRSWSPWKRWVAAEAGCTVQWLTRAVNNGTIRPPSKALLDKQSK